MDPASSRMAATASIPSSPGSSSLPSPPTSPQLHARHGHYGPGDGHHGLADSLAGSPLSIASSIPSVSSSFMFSQSATSSPPYIDPSLLPGGHAGGEHGSRNHTDSEHDPLGLVIPSLMLPPPVSSSEGTTGSSRGGRGHRGRHGAHHHQSAYGETLGSLELFIFGRRGSGKTAIANLLVDGNDDVISTAGWHNGTLTASTCLRDSHSKRGLRNVRITEIEGFDEEEDQAAEAIKPLMRLLHERFELVQTGLSPELPTSPQVMEMLASNNSPLPTALIFLLSTPPTALELTLLSLISTHIPTITLPPYPTSISTVPSFSSMPKGSQSTILLGPHRESPNAHAPFRPRNTLELRAGLFRSPETLRKLRESAAERFAHWREILHACDEMDRGAWAIPISLSESNQTEKRGKDGHGTIRKKNLEWELRLSRDVTIAFNNGVGKNRAAANKSSEVLASMEGGEARGDEKPALAERTSDPFYFNDVLDVPDPLHIPTLFRLSTALLGAFGKRLVSSLIERPSARQMGSGSYEKLHDDEETEIEGSWTLSKWGIAGLAFAIGYYAARLLAK